MASLPHSAYRIGDLKLVMNWRTSTKELFDLSKDLGEAHGLAATRPEETAELFAQLTGYLRTVNAEALAEHSALARMAKRKTKP